MYNPTYADTVFYAEASERAAFIRRTYAHLALAVLAFIIVEAFLVQLPIAGAIAGAMTGGFSWLIVLAAFMGVSWLAEQWANSDTSPPSSRGRTSRGCAAFWPLAGLWRWARLRRA